MPVINPSDGKKNYLSCSPLCKY